MNVCVNKSSREFKALQKKLNLSSATLANAIHTIWYETGDIEKFPTEEDIKRLLSPTPIRGDSNTIKVWKDRYSQPLNFPTREMATTSFAEAIQIFGKGSVRLIERMDGSVDVMVGSPQSKGDSIIRQMVDHLRSRGFNVLGRQAMEEFLKTHKLEYLQQYIDKHNLPKGELPVLSEALMNKYGNKTAYGDVICTANYEYTVNYKGAKEFDIIEYHKIDNNIKSDYYDRKNKDFSEYADERAIQDEVARRKYNSDSYNVEDREANGDNAGLDKSTSQGESEQTEDNVSSQQHQEWRSIKRDSATGRIVFVKGDGRTISTSQDWKNDTQLFTTPQGEIYGFVDKEGNIYLDETKISPEHPIHEYTHLWDRFIQKKNPKLWQRGVELMKQTSLWDEILNDDNYDFT